MHRVHGHTQESCECTQVLYTHTTPVCTHRTPVCTHEPQESYGHTQETFEYTQAMAAEDILHWRG